MCVAAQDTADSGAAADITPARLRYISTIYSPAPVDIYYLQPGSGTYLLSTIYSQAPVHDDVLTRVRVTTSLSRLQQLQCCTEASEASLPPAPSRVVLRVCRSCKRRASNVRLQTTDGRKCKMHCMGEF